MIALDHVAHITGLEDFRIIKTLGRGSFGKVRRIQNTGTRLTIVAEDQKNKRLVALKFIDCAMMSYDMKDRAEREIKHLKILSHPYIIQLYRFVWSKLMTDMTLSKRRSLSSS